MATRERKNGGDFVLESRHLLGLFVLLVLIFGVVFTLGYLLGRSQYDPGLRAAIGKFQDLNPSSAPQPVKAANNKPEDVQTPPSQKNADWDFYHAAEPKTAEDHLQPAPKTVVQPKVQPKVVEPVVTPKPTPKPSVVPVKAEVPARNSSPLNAPLIPKGAIMLQVAALQREGDALELAQALQQKKFPAYVLTPGADKYYRVQVGPYADSQSATVARQSLEDKGFKSIVKR